MIPPPEQLNAEFMDGLDALLDDFTSDATTALISNPTTPLRPPHTPRLPPPTLTPQLLDATMWSQNFVMELALALEEPDALCVRYNITPLEYDRLCDNPVFLRDLDSWRSRMADEGLSFKLKARVQAEAYLAEVDTIVNDPLTSPETKLAAISRMVEWAGMGPKQQQQTNSGSTVTINIQKFTPSEPTTHTLTIECPQ